jgi:ERO1-like protein alpha
MSVSHIEHHAMHYFFVLKVSGPIRNADIMESDLEIDGWARWDMPSNDYYDTEEFPEGYTGYDGSEVWNYIHKKICFDGYGYDGDHWKADYNKAVSGLHSVVSAQVTRGIQEKIDAGEEFTSEEVWRDPQVEFGRRLSANGETPLAMENLYFAYMLFLSAIAKVKDKLLAECASGMIDNKTASILQEFLSHPILSSSDVQGPSMKLQSHALQSTNDLWEARMRSRELLRIMNCVQCNKCRLHGKVATMGLSTALQVHLGSTGNGGDPARIKRVELASLISTMYKFTQAVDFCQKMRPS